MNNIIYAILLICLGITIIKTIRRIHKKNTLQSFKKERSTSEKGADGEKLVKNVLKKLNKKEYFVLNDIMLKTDAGTSQIDHLVISKYGIFIIETKNYSGLIRGVERGQNWTQQFAKSQNVFHNPIRQNYAHILALKNTLNLYDNKYYIPIVVFPNKDVRLSVETINDIVITSDFLIASIKENSRVVLNEERAKEIYKEIKNKNIKSFQKRRLHVKKLKQKYA